MKFHGPETCLGGGLGDPVSLLGVVAPVLLENEGMDADSAIGHRVLRSQWGSPPTPVL